MIEILMWIAVSLVFLCFLSVLLEPLARKAWSLFDELDELDKEQHHQKPNTNKDQRKRLRRSRSLTCLYTKQNAI